MYNVIKIKSAWFVYEDGASHAIAQPFPTKARAQVNADLRTKWAAEAIAVKAAIRADRLARVKAYLSARAARPSSAQLNLF